jgi:hypothetical protein
MGFANNLSNIAGKTRKPYYFMLFLFFLLFLIIYSERLFKIDNDIYHLVTTGIILIILIMIIISTILSKAEIGGQSIQNFNRLFNDSTCRNIIALFSFLFFVIYLYEIANYDNNFPHEPTDNLLFGHNNFISNRTAGIMYIISFALFTGYTISVNSKN